ncbi:hypothetical protein SBA3_690026 [Candidatus Sulfopaludibacter sp. SbA3]|nr:hypothetical protein SBA3_690026 [Candidatus Sulfopaludibacter sp. SbA3]
MSDAGTPALPGRWGRIRGETRHIYQLRDYFGLPLDLSLTIG